MKPIHKFNNGEGATICQNCYCAINLGWSDEVLCNKCKGYVESEKEKEKWKALEDLIDSERTFNKNNLNK
jgi:hypothetical protein